MSPVSPVFPTDIPADRLAKNRLVPHFTPPGPNMIYAPGTGGGANYGPLSYSPRTGLLYVNAIDEPLNSGRPARGYLSAFDPDDRRAGVAEDATTAGARPGRSSPRAGLLFVGSGSNEAGYFMAYDAKNGELLWKFNTGAGVFSSPSMYMVNGEQFVTVGSGGGDRGRRGGDLILSFALPRR